MKRKTFARLRLFALSLLLLEAVMLLVLLLAHNSASAKDGGIFSGPGKGAGVTGATHDGADSPGPQGASGSGGHSPYLCGGRDCPVGAADADGFGGPGSGGQDFTGHGGVNIGGGSSAGAGNRAGQDDADWRGPYLGFFAGGSGGGGGGASGGSGNGGKNSAGSNSAGDNSGANNSADTGDSDDKDSGGQQDAAGQDNGAGGDGGDSNPVLVSNFISPDAGNNDAGDPPPGAGDPLIVDITDPIMPVPEPMSGPLLAAGLAAMLVIRKRRSR